MERKWNSQWQGSSEVYSEEQVAAVIQHCGIVITYETATHFVGFCPFHVNTNDPAFEVGKTNGLWCCFNPSCAVAGNLGQLAWRLKQTNTYEFRRLVAANKASGYDMLLKLREAAPEEFKQFDGVLIRRLRDDFWNHDRAKQYMYGRGFADQTLEHFDIGYSVKQDMITVPMYDPHGMELGFIGRSVEGKRFQNSEGLPKSKTAWNYHRAKRYGDTVIVVESSFDAMRIHQAGYPNVVALLGGGLSKWHLEQLDRTFSTIIIMTDFDLLFHKGWCKKCNGSCRGHRPGRDLGWQIADALPHKKIRWAIWDHFEVFPHGNKDASDCTDAEIASMLKAPVSSLEYTTLDLDRIAVVQ